MQSYKQEKREVKRRPEQAMAYRVVCPLLLSLVIAVAGCASKTGSSSSAAGTYNTYAGTQNVIVSSGAGLFEGGMWTITLDDTNSFFSYLNTGDYSGVTPPSPNIGNFAAVNGFLDMTSDGGKSGSGGYAIEIPGDAVVFRPGNGTQYPVIGVASNSCQTPAANTTYQFVALDHPPYDSTDTSNDLAYGSIQATAQGTAWSFSNFSEYTLDGTSVSPAAFPSGTCAYTQEGYVVSIPSTDSATNNVPFTVAVGPTGFFMADLGQNGLNKTYGLVGTVKPSSQLSTSDIVAGKYIGFQYQQLQAAFNFSGSSVSLGSVTSPIAFGQTAGSGTAMTGGVYPNDDASQTPPSNITIDLGQQDSQNNGLYKSVTVTIPDTTGACISRSDGGKDANGNPTCIFPGVAVVGNPGGKYAVLVTANDLRAAIFSYTFSPIQFFLYQQ